MPNLKTPRQNNIKVTPRKQRASATARTLASQTQPVDLDAILQRALATAGNKSAQTDVMVLQRTMGNRAVQQMLTKVDSQRGRLSGQTTIQRETSKEYAARLREATDKLQNVDFGRVGNSEKFDKDFWEKKEDPSWGYILALKPGKKPSDAIDALFSKLASWSIDCAQFVQVAHMYAQRHTILDFDARLSQVRIELKPHGSTTLTNSDIYERDSPKKRMIKSTEPSGKKAHKPAKYDADDILAQSPIGSRVAWTNLKAPESSSFRNENTIKMGPNEFAAHGFNVSGKNRFTRQEIEENLAKDEISRSPRKRSSGSDITEYIRKNIFVSQIEVYLMPQEVSQQ